MYDQVPRISICYIVSQYMKSILNNTERLSIFILYVINIMIIYQQLMTCTLSSTGLDLDISNQVYLEDNEGFT